MKKIEPSIRRSIQLKSSWPGTVKDQQDSLALILNGLGIKYKRICNNISVEEQDYAELRRINLVAPAIYQRQKIELTRPVLAYVLNHQAQPEENEFLDHQKVIDRLEETGVFYSCPQEKELFLYFWIEKKSVIKFRKRNLQQYQDHLGVFFPSVSRF